MQKPALYTAAVIFAAVSLAHWVRYFLGWEMSVGGSVIPLTLSLWAGVITAGLAAWMAAATRRP